MKRILSIVAAIALLVTFMVPAFADTTYTITVDNPATGETYRAYKIFDVTYKDGAYAYTYHSDTFAGTRTDLDKLVAKIVEDDYFTMIATAGDPTVWTIAKGTNNDAVALDATDDPSEDVISNFAQYLKDLYEAVKTDGSRVWFTANIPSSTDTNGTITVAAPGYYFVTTTQGTFVSVNTTDPEAVIKDKTTTPEITKKVNGKDTEDVTFGETVTYTSTVTLTEGLTKAKFLDLFPSTVTFNTTSVTVKVGTDALATTNYTLNTTADDNRTFEIDFAEAYLNSIGEGETKTVVITYTGTVTADATINPSATTVADLNKNVATLQWGNNPQSINDTANVTTSNIVMTKTGKEGAALKGVEFKVYKDGANTDALNFILDENDGKYDYTPSAVTGLTTTTLVTDANGKIEIRGLDIDKYEWEETKTLDGYNLLTVRETSEVATTNSTVTFGIENTQGQELPETGGIGTIIFVTLGSIAVLAAGIFLISNKRISKEEL